MSSSYTTTTSATGMPTIDMEYHSKKTSITKANSNAAVSKTATVKTPNHRSKSYAGVLTPQERTSLLKSHSRSFSQSSPPSPLSSSFGKKELATSDETIFKVEIQRNKPVFFEGMDASESENENNESADEEQIVATSNDVIPLNASKNFNNNNNNNRTKFILDERLEDVKETPERENSVLLESTEKKDSKLLTKTKSVEEADDKEIENDIENTNNKNTTICDHHKDNENVSKQVETVANAPKRSLRKVSDTSRTLRNCNELIAGNEDSSNGAETNASLGVPSLNNQTRRKSSRELHMEYEIAISRDIDDMLNKVKDWDFPIFELSEKCNVLTQVS